jgi:hypothetical protein
MFKSRLQATYTVFVILGNILIQCNKEKFDLVAWLLLLHLALVATYPHIYEKWMGHTFTKNSAFGRNAGLHEIVRLGSLILLTLPLVVFLLFL